MTSPEPVERHAWQVRGMPQDLQRRIVANAKLRGITTAAYLTAVMAALEAVREYATSDDDDIAAAMLAVLEDHGLDTIIR